MIIHFIGLGGSGKTTIAKLLALKLDIQCFDLDEYFIENLGNISSFINRHGYGTYAKSNIELYLQLKNKIREDRHSILVCSSGFMTYRHDITPEYLETIQKIEKNYNTFLLMPGFDLGRCIEIIIQRQLSRSYLETTVEKEKLKIMNRFEMYNNLSCTKILTDCRLEETVERISNIIISELNFSRFRFD